MKTNKKLTRLILLLGLSTLPLGNVYAQSPGGDILLFGQNYSLAEGETQNGDIAVFGGNIEINEDAEVNGSVAIFGGNISLAEDAHINGDIALFGSNLTIEGKVDGDIVVFGGQVTLASDAEVDGSIATFGGQVSQEPGAEISGAVTHNEQPAFDPPNPPDVPEIPGIPNIPGVPDVPTTPNIEVNANPLANLIWGVVQAFIIAGIAMLLALFLQPQLERTGDFITRQPITAGAFGLLAFVVIPMAAVIMTLTLILIPVAAIVVLIAALAWLFGIIALGQEVGARFAKAINQTWAPVLSTGFGTLFLMLIVNLMNLVPCFGWIPSLLVMLTGVGAALVTWFGTRNPPGYIPPLQEADAIPPAS